MAAYGHVVGALYLIFVCLLVCNAHPLDDFNGIQDENLNRVKRAPPVVRQNLNPDPQGPGFPNVPDAGNIMKPGGGGGGGAVNNQHMGLGNAAGGGMELPPLNNQFMRPGQAGMGNNFHPNLQGQGRVVPPAGEAKSLLISASPECQSDVAKYCRDHAKNNFAVIDCLEGDLQKDDELTKECQHYLWTYKHNLTKDVRFEAASRGVCQKDLQKLPECNQLEQGSGFIIPCLLENMGNVSSKPCRQFIRKMANIIFYDYRLIYHFAQQCERDINTFQCGRVGRDGEESVHSQGRTIACLAERMRNLEKPCQLQVLRVFELSSDDYHMDRQLYYACRLDREHFCANITSGNGRVFGCLFKHMTSREMSPECQKKLELRQVLAAEDVKIDHAFYAACHKAITENHCEKHLKDDPADVISRAKVLRCLEGAIKNDRIVDKKCKIEMRELRTRIVDDYKISPDLMSRCAHEITNFCGGADEGGNTLHCLLSIAKLRPKKNEEVPKLSDQCKSELADLLTEADIGEDVTVDKTLMNACGGVIKTVCEHVAPGQGNIMTCLLENLDHEDMTDECEKRLLEVQYFIVRDFRLDNGLFKQCRKFAKNLCNAPKDWASAKESPTREQLLAGSLVLSCLHSRIQQEGKKVKKGEERDDEEMKVSRACKHEVKRVMRERAMSVDLHPDIQEACMNDLTEFCSEDREDTDKGAEIACLQDHMDNLEPKCKAAVMEFTEEEGEDIELDRILMKACTPMIKKFCGDELENDADSDEIMECLIENKNHHDMDYKCAAGITHHQLITMEDYKFSHKFKVACQNSVVQYCKTRVKKAEVVSCLSEHVRNDTLFDRPHRIDQECRRMLQVEVLQRGENIDLDPKLKKECKEDIKSFCSNLTPGNSHVIECLKEHKTELKKGCHALIFKREQDDFAIADYGILSSCKRMIKTHCGSAQSETEVFSCLVAVKDQPDFDQKCRTVILRRQIAQSRDYRLNPQLAKACHLDIPKFCKDVLGTQNNDEELEGKVVSCLEKQYIANKLSSDCNHEVKRHVRDKARDINLAPVLLKACRLEINRLCHEEFQEEAQAKDRTDLPLKESSQGRVEECLKDKFQKRQLRDEQCRKEVAYLVEEMRIDVNVDPLLQQACQKDIIIACRGFEPGEGRQMSCLLALLDDRPTQLTPQCRRMLEQRRTMWEYAAQVAPVEGFSELYEQISSSPAKAYILGVLAAVICVIFIVGITCGRVTKRVRAEMKNK